MFPPRCLERVDARLSLCARDRANLLDAAAAAAGIDDDKQLEPYETMGDFAAECKRIFDNVVARVDSTVVWLRRCSQTRLYAGMNRDSPPCTHTCEPRDAPIYSPGH